LVAQINPSECQLTRRILPGASFNNWLDAVDASFCTFEGGDDPTQDGIYPDPIGGPGAFEGAFLSLCIFTATSNASPLPGRP
jgi:hypothetical protein